MEEQLAADASRERLIVAGIRELETHGLNDFSLRRVALACGVSCAAPYRHFRDKEELILEIIRYINRRWTLLQDQIASVFAADDSRRLVEIGVAHIRFWIANQNFRSILLIDDEAEDSPRRAERNKISDGIAALISEYCRLRGFTAEKERCISYLFSATVYGTVLLLGNHELENSDENMQMVKSRLQEILEG